MRKNKQKALMGFLYARYRVNMAINMMVANSEIHNQEDVRKLYG